MSKPTNGDALTIPGPVTRFFRRAWPFALALLAAASALMSIGAMSWRSRAQALEASDQKHEARDDGQDKRLDSHEAEIRQHYTEIVQRLSRIEGKLDGKAAIDRPRVAEKN